MCRSRCRCRCSGWQPSTPPLIHNELFAANSYHNEHPRTEETRHRRFKRRGGAAVLATRCGDACAGTIMPPSSIVPPATDGRGAATAAFDSALADDGTWMAGGTLRALTLVNAVARLDG